MEKLRELLQVEVLQLNKAHDDKTRNLQQTIFNLERKVKEQ
jgi:hypothetical protein